MRRKEVHRHSLTDAMRARVSAYLGQVYVEDEGLLGNVDRWTQRRITGENLAKLELVLNSDDPAEACYRDLIREIDTEAETGIYVVQSDSTHQHLQRLNDEPGISGEMHVEVNTIAPIVFTDETANSTDDLDRVWLTIHATHDRAHVDASVSEIIMSFFLDDADSVRDMSNAMRALQYSYHEDIVRRRCNLPRILDDRDSRDLSIMVAELAKRSGSYQERVAAIRRQAST